VYKEATVEQLKMMTLSHVYKDLGFNDFRIVEWEEVSQIGRIPIRECVITRLYYKYGEGLRKKISENSAQKIFNAASILTKRMGGHGMPNHLACKVEYWHWMRIASDRLSQPQSIGRVLSPNCDDENASSYNHIPLRQLPTGKLLILNVPSWVTEDSK